MSQAAGAGEFRANNPGHRFESRFDSRGVRVVSTGGVGWEWGLTLNRWGRPEALARATAGRSSAREDRVELDRETLIEWFVNTPEGLEHGFTVPDPPEGSSDRLVFDFALIGVLRPVFAEDGQAVDFYGSNSVSVLRYAKLVVTDAAGAALEARMEPIDGGLRIAVEAAGATYPITVDPLATSPAWTAMGEGGSRHFARSVSTAGDVNGDGYSDVIVGDAAYSGSAGKAYLYLGGASGPSAGASWSVVGETLSSFGESVATAGDVNGDGYSDVVVGANAYSSFTGKAYLYLGGPGGLSTSASWSAVGEATQSQFGRSLATAGDVNGDGYSDVLVGAYTYSSGTGKAYLYLGGPGGLSTTASWSAVGEAGNNLFSGSVATAGDVNGDGYSDVLVGAYRYSSDTGKAYLYLGGPGGLSTTASWSAVGQFTSDYFGWAVATAGDVDGDGYSDVVVGARGYLSGTGKAYLYLGGTTGLGASPAWTAVGVSMDGLFATSVATAGDVDGDGYSDVLVGGDDGVTFTGKAYLYLGGSGGLSTSATWSIVGMGDEDGQGLCVATGGDVNGDGYSDVLIGDGGIDGPVGLAYIYLGGADGLSTIDGWSRVGEAANDALGLSVATAGDVNGDGYSDVVVGARGHAGYTGKAYLHTGGPGGVSPTASWSAVGEAGFNSFGFAVATAGDVNGDGYSDVIVGAYANDGSTGKAYLYLGGPAGLGASAAWSAVGEAAGDEFGYSVSTAGDVNGDGYSDVIVGAYASASLTGKAYLYLGGPGGLSTTASWSAVGEAGNDYFGLSVSTAGDVNGDGYSDVIVGAFGYGFFTGKAYLYLGGASGLGAAVSWSAVGEAGNNVFGYSLATAGDVNGDGYSDVIVGAANANNNNMGKAYLYRGGPAGLGATALWTAVGEASNDSFGISVATAGDINGDGYSDVVIGAYGNNFYTGKAHLYLGGAGGLIATASWTATGLANNDQFGYSVATAGDVDGDGFSDVAVGAFGYASSAGQAQVYFGGGGAGVPLLPRQLRADLSAPIHPGGPAHEQQFRLGLTLRSPVGRVTRQLQWQIAPWGGTFAPRFNPIRTDSDWYTNPQALSVLVALPDDLKRYLWRARVKYDRAQSPFMPHGPWATLSANGRFETDLFSTSQVTPPPCTAPDEEPYIYMVTLDGNGKPVLHYQDSNQPAAVTGYNIYRAPASVGPWTVIGSNVIDMDAGTPNHQYVDQTGDVGSPWFYKITAYNGGCGAEGPF